MTLNFNPYQVLGVSKQATTQEIKKAYYKLAKKYHPDTNAGDKEKNEKFLQINESYVILLDKDKRYQYDNGIYNEDGTYYSQDFIEFFKKFEEELKEPWKDEYITGKMYKLGDYKNKKIIG